MCIFKLVLFSLPIPSVKLTYKVLGELNRRKYKKKAINKFQVLLKSYRMIADK